MRKKAYMIHSKELESLPYPEGCPFNTSRAGRACKILDSMSLLVGADKELVLPEYASREELEKFHSARYLDALQRGASGVMDEECLEMGLGTPDSPFFPNMYKYPALATGASLAGARLIIDKGAQVVFNPSGGFHHAGAESAGGFCYINDIVLACMAMATAGMRVMFVDIDVHHCDGVQNAFYGRDDVLTFSMHESGKTLFPGTGFVSELGEGRGMGYSVNVPLPVGTYDEAYLKAFRGLCLPLIGSYNPDVIVLEVGMDTLAGDPLAHLNLTNNTHADIVSMIMKQGKPILATGGGGYNVPNTARGWALVWTVLSGEGDHDALLGLGGVMMGSAEWHGGLRDRMLVASGHEKDMVDHEVQSVIEDVKQTIFPIHKL